MPDTGPINPSQAEGFVQSGEAVAGYVLTADGAGQAYWAAASGGGGGLDVDFGLITDAPTSTIDLGAIV